MVSVLIMLENKILFYIMYSRYNYYTYYELKKHLYRERYLDKKERQKRIDEIYEKYGGEKEYIKDYWVNKRWKLIDESSDNLVIDENKIKCNSNNDRSETNEGN